MYKGKKILAFIPARSGSKRLKDKNIQKINNISLFEYSVNIAKKSKYIDEIIVSSDSIDILNRAHQLGCYKNELRPAWLSKDDSRIVDAIIFEVDKNNLNDYNAVVLLQPTSPNRTKELLDGAIEKYFETETSLITVANTKENPIFLRTIKDGKLKKVVSSSSDIRSQELEKTYKIVGNIYINNLKTLDTNTILNENEIPYLIDDMYDIDIDDKEDLELAKEIMNKSRCL